MQASTFSAIRGDPIVGFSIDHLGLSDRPHIPISLGHLPPKAPDCILLRLGPSERIAANHLHYLILFSLFFDEHPQLFESYLTIAGTLGGEVGREEPPCLSVLYQINAVASQGSYLGLHLNLSPIIARSRMPKTNYS
jgi:hypothetical protein